MGVLEGYTQLADTIMKGFGNLARQKERGAESLVDQEKIRASERVRQGDPAYQEKQYMSQLEPVRLQDYAEPGNMESLIHVSDSRVSGKLAELFNRQATFSSDGVLTKPDGTPVMVPRWLKDKMSEPATGILMANFDIRNGLDSQIDRLKEKIPIVHPEKRATLQAKVAELEDIRNDKTKLKIHYEDYADKLNKMESWAVSRKAGPGYMKMIENAKKETAAKISELDPVKIVEVGDQEFWVQDGKYHRIPPGSESDLPIVRMYTGYDDKKYRARMAAARAKQGLGLNDFFVMQFASENPALQEVLQGGNKDDIDAAVNSYIEMLDLQQKQLEKRLPSWFPATSTPKEPAPKVQPALVEKDNPFGLDVSKLKLKE